MTETDSRNGDHAGQARTGGHGPRVDFADQLPYDEYVQASTLHSLQRPRTDAPGEMSFLVITQVMELYFTLIRYELEQAQQHVRADDTWAALAPLRRAALHLQGLDGAWHGLRWMTPADFNRFREELGEASGFQSAMYRRVELLLGLKSASLIRPFRRDPQVHQRLTEALHGPSLWDDVLALLARRGHQIPPAVRDRDRTVTHDPDPDVAAAWIEIYRDESPDNHLRLLGEALTEVAERFQRWRERHVMMIRRTMGTKTGTGGSAGLTWVQERLAQMAFPELWSARSGM